MESNVLIDYVVDNAMYAFSAAVGAAVMHATAQAREDYDKTVLFAGIASSFATYGACLYLKSKIFK